MLHDYKIRPAIVAPREESKQAGEDLWLRHKAERGIWTKPMLTALEQGIKGNKWFSLIDKVYHPETLEMAWRKVKSNAGGCGIDNISVEFFQKDSLSRLLTVSEQIRKERYRPQPIKRVEIPKLGSKETRPLGIPTIRDRVVQTALRMVIEPIFEKEFSPHSFGFRPGCSCKDALRTVETELKAGYTHVVDIDIKGYFDAIPHEKLTELIKRRISDSRVLQLIEQFLRQGVLEEGVEVESVKGSPQGGAISPLLANIYLNPLDWILSRKGYRAVRYADDLVVLTQTAQEAEQALALVKEWMNEAELTLHPEKTKIVDMGNHRAKFSFLGYVFYRGKAGELQRHIRAKSIQKLRAKVRPYTKRCNGHSLDAIIRKLNPLLKGWYQYFKHVKLNCLREVDGWIRMRLRSILRKRNHLKGKGRGKDHKKWSNSYFRELGLFSLEYAQKKEVSLRKRSKMC